MLLWLLLWLLLLLLLLHPFTVILRPHRDRRELVAPRFSRRREEREREKERKLKRKRE